MLRVTSLVAELVLECGSDSPHVLPMSSSTIWNPIQFAGYPSLNYPSLKLILVDSESIFTILSTSSDGFQQFDKCRC